MIYNIRGASGSGKSYPGFKLLQAYGPGEEIRRPAFRTKKPKLIGHILPGGLVLTGRYILKGSTRVEGAGYSGGVDGFYPMDELQEMIEGFVDEFPHVFFESLLISGTHVRWRDFGFRYPHGEMVFGILDTDPDLMIKRILTRNGGKPVKEEQIKGYQRQVVRTGHKLEGDGFPVQWVDTEKSFETVRDTFLEAGWNPYAEQEELQNELQAQEQSDYNLRMQDEERRRIEYQSEGYDG